MKAPAVVDMLLDVLLRNRTEEQVRAIFNARLQPKPKPAGTWEQLSLAFGGPRQKPVSDMARFASVMNNFDEALARALMRKRDREAAEEAMRAAAAKKRRPRPIRPDSVKGKILSTLRTSGEPWSIRGIVDNIGCTVTAARVFAHEMVKDGLLTREKRGVYRAVAKE